MTKTDIKWIRAMINDGMGDADIADAIVESDVAEAEYEAMYGPRDEDDASVGGPAALRCDDYYRRNDAGEWVGLM